MRRRGKRGAVGRRALGVVLGGALSLLACRGTFSGIDGNKRGFELTTEEVKRLCRLGVGRRYDIELANAAAMCRGTGVLAADALWSSSAPDLAAVQDACTVIEQACSSQETPEREAYITERCEGVASAPECTSTVSEIEGCMQQLGDAIPGFYGRFPECAALTDQYFDDPDRPTEFVRPPACDTISANCPEAVAIVL